MSYILDALRRADLERERERSAVPGLNTQAVPAGGTEGDIDTPRSPWKWPVAAAFTALLGLVAWLWWERGDAPEPVLPSAAAPPLAAPAAPPAALPAGTATPAAPAAPAVSPVTATAAPPPAAVAATGSTPTTPATTATAPGAAGATRAADPAPSARKPPSATATTAAAATAAARKPPATASPAAAAVKAAAPASEPEEPILTLSQLPDEVRRELPAVTVGGSIYSKSAANRMLVINGQVFHEGDELAPSLVLEQIKPKAAVLKYKSYRYEITY